MKQSPVHEEIEYVGAPGLVFSENDLVVCVVDRELNLLLASRMNNESMALIHTALPQQLHEPSAHLVVRIYLLFTFGTVG